MIIYYGIINWDAGGKSHKHTKWKAKQLSIELSNKQVKIILNIGGHILRAKWIKLDKQKICEKLTIILWSYIQQIDIMEYTYLIRENQNIREYLDAQTFGKTK